MFKFFMETFSSQNKLFQCIPEDFYNIGFNMDLFMLYQFNWQKNVADCTYRDEGQNAKIRRRKNGLHGTLIYFTIRCMQLC